MRASEVNVLRLDSMRGGTHSYVKGAIAILRRGCTLSQVSEALPFISVRIEGLKRAI